MIYLEPHQLGWRPFKDSYMQHQCPKTLNEEHLESLNDLFDWLIQPCLDFIRHNCKMLIETSPMHLVFTVLRLYNCLLDEIDSSGKDDHETLTAPQVGR